MHARTAHHYLTKLDRIRLLYFLGPALVLAVVAVIALRQNNQHMAELRQAVYTADENNGDIEGSLQDLRNFVTTHMNTGLNTGDGVYPPIQLKYTYSRLVQAAGTATGNANTTIYNDAQHYCEGKIPTGFSGRYRLDCIEDYVQSHGGAPATNIPDSLYKFDFVSPTWSPDLAGLSILGSGLLVLGAIGYVIVHRLLEVQFKRKTR
jgi:hypothetical protein